MPTTKTRIQAWQDLRLPASLVQAAATLDVPHGLRDGSGVDFELVVLNGQKIRLMIADGHCATHRDWPEISLIWVVRNDTGSWVKSQGVRANRNQPSGTVVLLDINHPHSLDVVGGQRNGKKGVWAAAVVHSFTRWPTTGAVERQLAGYVQTIRTVEQAK